MPELQSVDQEARRERLAAQIAILAFAVGLYVRYLYIFRWHPMLEYIYSDMEMYRHAIELSLDPKWIPDISDTVYPPGTKFFFRWLTLLDPSMDLAMTVQYLMACATPVLVGLIGAKLFSRRTGYYSCAMASLYFPLFDFNGYLMSEGPFIFFLLLASWCFFAGLKTASIKSWAYALASGVLLGICASIKSVALPVAALIVGALIFMTWKHKLKLRGFIAAGTVGLLLVLVPLAVRATRLSEGRFCLVANELSRSVLIGHYGNVQMIDFQDAKRNYFYTFGCPSATQKGYTREVALQMGVYENGKVLEQAWTWTKAHPITSFMLSIEHVFDLFFTSEAWPSYDWPLMRHWVVLFHEIFIVFILFPAVLHLQPRWREMLRLNPSAAPEIFLTLPLIALMAAAFIAIGEARYRIPFDGFIIILAARYFTRNSPAMPPLFQLSNPALSVAPPPAMIEAPISPRDIPSRY
jgi:hypothetical protein